MRGNDFYLVFVLFICLGCDNNIHTFYDYKQWFNDDSHGYIKTQQIDDLVYTVQFKPYEYMALSDFDENENYSQLQIDEVLKGYGKGNFYFLLEIKANENVKNRQSVFSNLEEYNRAMDQLAFRMGEMCRLSVGNNEYDPVIHHMEKEYEITRKYRVLIGFQPEENSQEFTFIFNDEIFNGGKLKFYFTPDTAPKLPLKIKT